MTPYRILRLASLAAATFCLFICLHWLGTMPVLFEFVLVTRIFIVILLGLGFLCMTPLAITLKLEPGLVLAALILTSVIALMATLTAIWIYW